ncbi:Uncharacterized membrane protein, DUF2061 family [Halanaeroarchaeum sp. HSR-CO]|uniref:DUF2061 domain-containing protein n=1 Tax=Halanaeroarchaeum sp. HSR-CO TaxID=2866382 RepID=UPI00217D97E1|nr:DUF2061 domain-containing protein [Halanaeroarchaeum sp. HSR-CO]UWG48170.1 Uncharacterized membrane protein, DUF2061 family [Halanaeroarchaeum sp. HSR-CO]
MTAASHRRSIVKAASYRLFATSLVFLVAYVYTGSAGPAAKIGVTAAVGKTLLYYLWERVWSRISWGIETA